ncbi:MAG: hypothetical protein AAB217_04280, partial [Chloroflexota bacterium]
NVALPITNAVCDCRQPMATVYRVLYGGRCVGRDVDAAQDMASHLAPRSTKRLEQGTFSWPAPAAAGHAKLSLTPEALTLLTDGVDLRDAKLRPWYQRE